MNGRIITLFFIIALVLLFDNNSYSVDVLAPRVPLAKLSEAKNLKNVVSKDANSLARGKEIFLGKGTCFNCHGKEGGGDGILAASFNPKPRDFTDNEWQKARADGEIFWAITYGTEYGMMAFESMLSAEEIWELVNHIRELGKESESVK